MRNFLRFLGQCFGLVCMMLVAQVSRASLEDGSDFPSNDLADKTTFQDEVLTMGIDVQSEVELERLNNVIDLLGLSPEVQSFENGRLIIKLPKNQMILLAGQIWLGK